MKSSPIRLKQKLTPEAATAKKIRDKKAAMSPARKAKKAENQRIGQNSTSDIHHVNGKVGNTKRHMHKIFDVDTDYFLFYKILGKYLFIEKQGLDNQIWTKEYKEMIIKLKQTEFERDHLQRQLDAKSN